jgi:hypothetical protein
MAPACRKGRWPIEFSARHTPGSVGIFGGVLDAAASAEARGAMAGLADRPRTRNIAIGRRDANSHAGITRA